MFRYDRARSAEWVGGQWDSQTKTKANRNLLSSQPFFLSLPLLFLSQWYSVCSSGNRVAPRLSMELPGQSPLTAQHLQTAYKLVPGYQPTCDAFGFYTDDVDVSGWGYLHVESNPSKTDHIQYYAGGYLEGALTALRIYQSKVNFLETNFANGTVPPKVWQWIAAQNSYVGNEVEDNPTDAYWVQAANIYTQIQGMYDGYSSAADPKTEPLTIEELLLISMTAESVDILAAVDPTYRESIDVLKMKDIRKVKKVMDKLSHCSALIRLSPDKQDLFVSHTTVS